MPSAAAVCLYMPRYNYRFFLLPLCIDSGIILFAKYDTLPTTTTNPARSYISPHRGIHPLRVACQPDQPTRKMRVRVW
jgi:hypothetical protein